MQRTRHCLNQNNFQLLARDKIIQLAVLLVSFMVTSVFSTANAEENPVTALEAQGFALVAAGRFEEAVKAFRDARAAAEALKDVPARVRMIQNEAKTLKQAAPSEHSKLYEQALQALQNGLKLAQDAKLPMLEDSVLADLSMLYNARGDYGMAVKCAEQAVALHQRTGNKVMAQVRQQVLDTMRIVLLKDQGKLDEALAMQTQQLEGARAALAAALNAKKPEGLTDELWKQVQQSQAGGQRIAVQAHLAGISVTLTELGRYSEALNRTRESLDMAKSSNDPMSLLTAHSSLAWLYVRIGAFEQALQSAQAMQRLMTQTGDSAQRTVLETSVATSLPWIYAAFGDYETALQWLQRWTELVEKSAENNAQLVLPLIKSVEYLQRLDRAQEAVPLADRAVTAAEAAKTGNIKWLYEPQALIARGGLRVQLDQVAEGLADLLQAREILEKSKMRGRDFLLQECQARLAEAYLKAGRADEAIDAARKFAQVLDSPVAQTVHWRAHYLLGRAQELKGDLQSAKASYLAALKLIEAQQVRMTSTEVRTSFVADKAPVYHALVRVLLKLKDTSAALDAMERGRSRALLTLLQRGQVRVTVGMTNDEVKQEDRLLAEIDRLNERLAKEASRSSEPTARATSLAESLRQAQGNLIAYQQKVFQRLPELAARRGQGHPFQSTRVGALTKTNPGMVVLEYLLGETESFLFVVGGAGSQSVTAIELPVTRRSIAARVRRLRKACLKGQDMDSYVKASDELRAALIDPAKEMLTGKKLIVVVPDGDLTDLPFHALTVATVEGPRYLVEDFAFAYVPSLGVLEQALARSKTGAAGPERLVAFGNPVFGATGEVTSASRGTLSPLPGTQVEVDNLAKLYGKQAVLYTAQHATEEEAKKEAPTGERVHFATHGLLDPDNPFNSALAFTQADSGGNDGFLEAREIAAMSWRSNLVVLSACETARGKPTAGEGVVGLSWSLFAAGVPSTVAGLWKVSDASTAQLMVEFHKQLTSGIGKTEALRLAEVSLLHSEEFKHPFYWAPFILVGSPN